MYIDNRILQVLAGYLLVGIVYQGGSLMVGWRRADEELKEWVRAVVQHTLFQHGFQGFVAMCFGILMMLLLWPLRMLKNCGVLKD